MSDRKLAILGVVAAFMVIWAVVQSRLSSRPKTEPDKPAYLIQGLDPGNIGSIVVGAGEDSVTLKRTDKGFVVVNKDNYRAKASEINDLLTKCLEIQTSQFITDDVANHKDLEVTEQDARYVVKFLKPEPNSPLLTGVIIGKSKEKGEGAYVRLAASNKVYVATNVPSWLKTRALDYIEQELISVERDDIESVTVGSKDGQYTLKTKEDSKDIVLENIPEGKKLKTGESDSVFTALANLRFDDVVKSKGGLVFDRQFACRLKDSTVYTINLAQQNDKTYAICNADFTDKTPVMKEKAVESQEELKTKEAKLLARDKAKAFSVKHQGWVYEIPDYKAKNLTKKLSDLIENIERPEEAEKETIKPPEPNAVKAEDPNSIKLDEPNAAKPGS